MVKDKGLRPVLPFVSVLRLLACTPPPASAGYPAGQQENSGNTLKCELHT